MENCYSSMQYRIYSWINIILGLLSGSLLLLVAFFVRCESLSVCFILAALGIIIIIYTGTFVVFLNRKYEVSEKGIVIQYLNRYVVVYSWEKIQSVCVGVTHRSGTGITQDVVIWCTTKKRKIRRPTADRRTISWEYDFFHYNSIITIEFSEERYKTFAFYYQKDIPDYR